MWSLVSVHIDMKYQQNLVILCGFRPENARNVDACGEINPGTSPSTTSVSQEKNGRSQRNE